MADDDRNRRKPNSSRDVAPDVKETCIGVWSRSTKGHPVAEAEQDKICNGISIVIIKSIKRGTDVNKVKLSNTRGLQVVFLDESEKTKVPHPKAHDHTNIRVDTAEADDKLAKNDDSDANSTEEQGPSLTRRVMDVMMMKKTNLEKSVEHYKNEGVKLTDVWNGFYSTCSNCYETTARLVSYCHPIEKVGQMFGFADRYIRKAGRYMLDDEDNEKKK